MRQVPLWFPFGIASCFALFGTVFLTPIKLFSFAPFLALLYQRKSFISSLWIAALCGLIIDLFSSEWRLGIHSLNYCVTTFFLYKQKRHFFEDKALSLCLFTLLISIFSSLLQLLLISLFERSLPLSKSLFATDLFLLPIVDGIYAFVAFYSPMCLFLHIKKIGWRTFIHRILAWFYPKVAKEKEE